MPIDFKKLEMMDIVVVDEPWTPEEQKAFSAFLKARKAKEALKIGKLKPKKKTPAKAKSR
jgi:hypothetical protein